MRIVLRKNMIQDLIHIKTQSMFYKEWIAHYIGFPSYTSKGVCPWKDISCGLSMFFVDEGSKATSG